MKKKISILIIVLLLVSGGVMTRYKRNKANENPYLTENAIRTNLEQTVSASGHVKSSSEVLLAFDQSGRVENIAIGEGSHVIEGTVLATLDQASAQSRFDDAQAAVAAAQAEYDKGIVGATQEERKLAQVNLDNANTNLTATRAKASADVVKAEQAVEEAAIALTAAKTNAEQDRAARLNDATTAVDAAEKKIRGALNTLEELFDTDDRFRSFITTQNLQTSSDAEYGKTQADEAWQQLALIVQGVRSAPNNAEVVYEQFPLLVREAESIRTALSLTSIALNNVTVASSAPKTLATYRTEVLAAWADANASIAGINDALVNVQSAERNGNAAIALKQSSLDSSKTSLASVRANADSAISNAEAEVRRLQAEYDKVVAPLTRETRALLLAKLEQARSNLATANAALDATRLISPIEGTITKIHVKTGETVSPGQTVIRMLTANHLEVSIQVAEADIPKIRTHDKTDLQLDAFGSGRIFPGTVVFINPAETLVEGVVYYDVTIAFTETGSDTESEDLQERIKPGMSADATIYTDERTDVIAIPLRAIKNKDGQAMVEIMKRGNETEERPVVTGLRADNGLIEITDGLEEGDIVVVGTKKK